MKNTITLQGKGDIRKKVMEMTEALSEVRLQAVLDFIAFLKEREEWETTYDILAAPQMMADIKEADKDWEQGKKDKFIPWAKVRRNV